MNVKLLRKIQKHILAEPRRLDMEYLYTPKHKRKAEPPCGTVCCIAGWAIWLSYKKVEPEYDALLKADGTSQDVFSGEALLDLSGADHLFFIENWPRKYRDAYESAKTPAGRARTTSNRIDHFIATKGAE